MSLEALVFPVICTGAGPGQDKDRAALTLAASCFGVCGAEPSAGHA